jgi:hypothetical protein
VRLGGETTVQGGYSEKFFALVAQAMPGFFQSLNLWDASRPMGGPPRRRDLKMGSGSATRRWRVLAGMTWMQYGHDGIPLKGWTAHERCRVSLPSAMACGIGTPTYKDSPRLRAGGIVGNDMG